MALLAYDPAATPSRRVMRDERALARLALEPPEDGGKESAEGADFRDRDVGAPG